MFWDRGIARYIVEHSAALLDVAPERVHTVRASAQMSFTPSLLGLLPSGKVRRTRAEPHDSLGRAPAIHHVMSPLEWGYPIEDVWPLWARDPGCVRMVTLYDLIPFVFPEKYKALLSDRIGYDARVELTRRADHVLAISEHTARDATHLLGIPRERITVIGAAATSRFGALWPRREDAREFVRRRFTRVDREFAFYVGGQDERKNLPGLFEAWAGLDTTTRDRTQLVVACDLSPDRRATLERHCARHGLRPSDVTLTGRVDDHELAALYRACSLFLFPSLYEGSGLPVLEAMAAEAPVVAAKTSTGPELLGDGDGTFDPHDPRDMAAVIDATLNDPTLLARYRARSALRTQEFSWRKVAERTLAAYDDALQRRRPGLRRVRRSRMRVALIAPGPRPPGPADSALSRLVAQLAAHADVEVIREGAPRGDEIAAPAAFELRRGRGYYDRTIHVLGPQPAHRYPYETLLRDPGGIILFEDVRLGEFHRWYGTRVAGPAWLRSELERQYGEVLPPTLATRGAVSAEDVAAHGMFFTRRVQRLATALVVPSALAAAMLEVDRLDEPDLAAPVAVLPPVPPAADGSAAGDSREVIVSIDSGASKCAELLIDVLAVLARRRPAVSLALLGEDGGAKARERLLALARARRVDGRLTLAGSPDSAERADRVQSASVAVVPRPPIDVTSIAFAQECLAAGVPVVVVGQLADPLADQLDVVEADASADEVAKSIERLLDGPRHRRLRRHSVTLGRSPVEGWLELLGMR